EDNKMRDGEYEEVNIGEGKRKRFTIKDGNEVKDE
ncbi:unnamed protein product, partial [marine sediment metagenome]